MSHNLSSVFFLFIFVPIFMLSRTCTTEISPHTKAKQAGKNCTRAYNVFSGSSYLLVTRGTFHLHLVFIGSGIVRTRHLCHHILHHSVNGRIHVNVNRLSLLLWLVGEWSSIVPAKSWRGWLREGRTILVLICNKF